MSNFDWQHPTVERVIARYTTLNRKSTPQDCEASHSVKDVAEYYAANYEGSFEFMVKMHGVMDNFSKLSNAQASGVINCLLAEYRFKLRDAEKAAQAFKTEELPLPAPTFASLNIPRELQKGLDFVAKYGKSAGSIKQLFSKPTAATERPTIAICSKCGSQQPCIYDEALAASCADTQACAERVTAERIKIVTQVVANGIYTIVLNEKGDYRTLRISDAPDSMAKRKGTQIAAYLSAPDNESDKSYTGFAFVMGSDVHLWRSSGPIGKNEVAEPKQALAHQALKVLVTVDSEKRADFGEAYALESKRCWRCNRLLTVTESITRGLGPICAEKLGY